MESTRGVAAGLALALLLAGCPGAKAPTAVGGGTKPRTPRATSTPKLSVAAIPQDALAKATQGLAARVVTPAGAPTTLTGKVKIISDNGGGIISDNGGGIISNNSGAIISDNGGGIVANNGGSIVANNGSSLRLLQGAAPTAEFALADAVLTFQDAAGNLLTTPDGKPLVAYTDKKGDYKVQLPLPAENVVVRIRLWNGGELAAMAPRDAGAARELPVDTATSLGAAYVLENYVRGDQKTYDKLPASEAAALREALVAARGEIQGAPTYERDALVGLAETIRTKAPAVDKKLEDIKALLIGQANLGAGLPATEVALPDLDGMIVDRQGRLLMGDSQLGRIQAVLPDGTTGTYADVKRGDPVRQSFTELDDLVIAPDGAVYVSATNSVYRCAADGTVKKVAGSGFKDRGELGGQAAETNLQPSAIALTPDGTLYLVDTSTGGTGPGTRLLAVGPDGVVRDVTTEVNPAAPGYMDLAALPDGSLYTLSYDPPTVHRWKPGEPARVLATLPSDEMRLDARMAVGPDGTVYVTLPSNGKVVAVAPDGTQRTIAGQGGPAGTQAIQFPTRLACGADGTVYVYDRPTSMVYAIAPDGAMKVVAGTAGTVRAEAGLTSIAINRPYAVAFDRDGGLVYSENGGYALRRFAGGVIAPFAGAGLGDGGDGGPATAARLRNPGMVVIHGDTTWVVDEGNQVLRAIGPDGTIRTVVGSRLPPGNTAEMAGLTTSLALGQRVAPDKVLLSEARGVAVDAAGRPYWSMSRAGQIWRLSDGMVEHVAGGATSAGGNLGIGLDVLASLGLGKEEELAATASIATPFGLAFDAKGDLYVAETVGFRVRKITGLAGGTPMIRMVAGKSLPQILAFDGGPVGSVEGWSARDIAVPLPLGVCFDGDDRLIIGYGGTSNLLTFSSSLGDDAVLPPGMPTYPPGVIRIEADGKVHHVAGAYSRYFPDVDAEDAVAAPAGLAVDAEGRLAIADFSANLLRVLPAGTTTGVKAP